MLWCFKQQHQNNNRWMNSQRQWPHKQQVVYFVIMTRWLRGGWTADATTEWRASSTCASCQAAEEQSVYYYHSCAKYLDICQTCRFVLILSHNASKRTRTGNKIRVYVSRLVRQGNCLHTTSLWSKVKDQEHYKDGIPVKTTSVSIVKHIKSACD